MIQRIQSLGQGQRILIFALFFVGGILLIIGITVFLIYLSLNTGDRLQAIALDEPITVSEFVYLPDDDAYPATVAVGEDGTIYTGSYTTGAVWAIAPDKPAPQSVEADAEYITELPNTREQITSVRDIETGDNGVIYVLDGGTSDPRQRGGVVWTILPDGAGTITPFGQIEREPDPDAEPDTVEAATGFLSPFAIALDSERNVYVTDRGLREVWRFSADGMTNSLFWTPPEGDVLAVPTGIAYDPTSDTLLITDSETNIIYRVGMDGQLIESIYHHTGANPPGFTGITVAPDGTIYAAAIDQNGIVRVEAGAGEDALTYIVGNLRGANDMAVGADGQLYVTNFDSSSLVVPGTSPQLPFSLDVVTFGEGG